MVIDDGGEDGVVDGIAVHDMEVKGVGGGGGGGGPERETEENRMNVSKG